MHPNPAAKLDCISSLHLSTARLAGIVAIFVYTTFAYNHLIANLENVIVFFVILISIELTLCFLYFMNTGDDAESVS